MKYIINATLLVVILLGGSVFGASTLAVRDVTVLPEPANRMMQDYLTKIVDGQFAARSARLAGLKTAADWQAHVQTIREFMVAETGPLPARTPLNARVTRRLERDGYVVENLIFESRPNFFVTGNLYLPKGFSGRRPTLLNVIGHAQVGKADERYQRMSMAQVRKGFVVLTIDTIGQGERGLLSAHHIVGRQAFISGTHLFNFMVWDTIRAIDYLVSRPEVASDKICITGSSGGGMMSTYILPFDDRILVAIPTCNPNTWSHRVHANLATDHEQVFFGAFARGIDPRGDPLFVHAPKPLLVNATTDDNLNPVRGVWELGTWLYKAYATYNAPEKVFTSMVKAGHAYNQEQREISYAWMLRWTGEKPSMLWEGPATLEKPQDLWAARGGSVFNEPGSRQPRDLVLDYLAAHRAKWSPVTGAAAAPAHRSRMRPLVTEVLHTRLDDTGTKGALSASRRVGELSLRTLVLEPEAGIKVPGVLLEPAGGAAKSDVILYVNEGGKEALTKDMPLISEVLGRGYRILAVDLRGYGETAPDLAGKFWDFLAGKPIFGQRVGEVLAIARWLKGSELRPTKIHYWGTGMPALYGAFAGVLSDDFAGFLLEEPLLSFESVVQVEAPQYNHEVLLPGILKKFDMPQVYQALSPRPVTLLNPRLGDKSPAPASAIAAVDQAVSPAYSREAWTMRPATAEERRNAVLGVFGR